MKRIYVLFCFVFLCITPVFGQEMDLGPIVVTGGRMEQTAGSYGGNVTVLGQKEIASSGAGNAAELLESAASISMTRKGTSRSAIVDIRGFGDTSDRNVLILLNGRKLNNVDNLAVDLSMIPLESIDRLEVIRGAGSVLYGDNAVGGVVNIITKKGKGPMTGSAATAFGSYGARSASTDLSGSEGKAAYFLSSRYTDNKGYRSNSDVLAKDFNAAVDYTVSEKLSLVLDTIWHEDHYGLPGGLNAAGLAQYGRRGSDEEENYGDTKDRRFGVSTTIKPWEDPLIDGKFIVDYSFRNQDSYGLYDYASWGSAGTKREIDTHGLLTKYVHQAEAWGRRYNAVLGTDFYDVTSDIWGSGTGVMASTDDITISKEEFGMYGYGEFEVLPKVFTGTGIRYQRAQYDFDQRSGTPAYTSTDPSETVRKGILRYEYAERSNLYLSAEETFRFLSTDESYSTWTGLDTTLKHQTGIQYELGWKHDFNRKVQLSLVPYWIENENEIYVDPTVSPGYNKNYDETRRRGVEVSSAFDLLEFGLVGRESLKELQLETDYRFQKAEFRDGIFAGNDVPMASRHQAGLRLAARLNNGFGVSLGERFIGPRYVINDTSNLMPKEKMYFLTDLKFSLVKTNWEASLAVNNLFDRMYNDYAAKSTGGSTNIEYYPAAGRNFTAGMKVRF